MRGTAMKARLTDMAPVVDLTRSKGTGPVRFQRPIYTDLLPPCNNACPAGENIQGWLELAQAGKYREAWETLVRDNPLPAVHGRPARQPWRSGISPTRYPFGYPTCVCNAASAVSCARMVSSVRSTSTSHVSMVRRRRSNRHQ